MKLAILLFLLSVETLSADAVDTLRKAIRFGDFAAMENLLSAGMNPDMPDAHGQTPLAFALLVDGTRAAEVLLAWHADPNAPLISNTAANTGNGGSETPLEYAIQSGNLRMASLLISAGARVNQPGKQGRTPLHRAGAADRLDMVRLLLGNGADPNARDAEGASPLDDAAWRGSLDVAALLVAGGQRVVALQAERMDEVLGANTISEVMHLDTALRAETAQRLMAQGVTIFRPDTCVIDAEVTVGPDTVIEPYVQLLGTTRIGSECLIRSYSVVQHSVLGNGVVVRNGCILDHAEAGDGAVLGPYAHLRPQSRIGELAHVGNFCETKKTTLGRGSKVNHLTYLGDAVIGAGVNVGAGVITCNYDGAEKHTTTIGDGVFVGSDSTLVAPVSIGDGAYVGAGSCITESVPAGALAIGRSRQVTKEGWAAARRAASAAAQSATQSPKQTAGKKK